MKAESGEPGGRDITVIRGFRGYCDFLFAALGVVTHWCVQASVDFEGLFADQAKYYYERFA